MTDSDINTIKNSIYNLDDQEIKSLQQYVLWHFVEPNNPNSNYTKIEIKKWEDVKKIKHNGNTMTDNKAKAGFALYQALFIGAIKYANGTDGGISNQNKFKITYNNASNKTIKCLTEGHAESYYDYEVGPFTLDSKNVDEIKLIKLTGNPDIHGHLKWWNIKYGNNYSSSLFSTNSTSHSSSVDDTMKDNLLKYSFKIVFRLDKELESNPAANLSFEGSYKQKLDSCKVSLYKKADRQPLLGINKTLVKNPLKESISFAFDGPNTDYLDLALTKQINKVFRYNTSSNKYKQVGTDYNRLINIKTDDEGNGISYDMNKQQIKVMPGDIVRYKITLYNEGNIDGYVKQVTDLLPLGLEYSQTENGTFKAQTYITNNETTGEGNSYNVVRYKFENYLKLEPGESKDIYIECKVTDKATLGSTLRNVAVISSYGYYKTNSTRLTEAIKEYIDIDSVQTNIWDGRTYNGVKTDDYISINAKIGNYLNGKNILNIDKGLNGILQDDEDFEQIEVGKFDLALRKFITKVNDEDETSRTPKVSTTKLMYGQTTTAEYAHTKKSREVNVGDTVTYTIRVYNEGTIDGVVTQINDYLPQGLTLKNNSSINSQYGWNQSGGFIYTDKVSTISARSGNALNYEDYKVECTVETDVTNNTVLRNVAEIYRYGYYYYNGTENELKRCNKASVDIDSIDSNIFTKNSNVKNIDNYYTNVIKPQSGEGNVYTGLEDDDDFESIIVKNNTFDLALRKYIQKIVRDGQEIQLDSREPVIDASNIKSVGTATYKHPKNSVQVKPGDEITYVLRVYNEGYLEGTVKEVTDYLPNGLEFINDNNGWSATDGDNGTTILKYNTEFNIAPSNRFSLTDGEFYKDITVRCRVKSVINNKRLTNVAEISNYGWKNGNTYVKADNTDSIDTDSQFDGNGKAINVENNINTEISTYYRARKVSDIYPAESYTGKQDDDDFESVVVEAKYKCDVTIEKRADTFESNEFLEGTKFKLEMYSGNGAPREVIDRGFINLTTTEIISPENELTEENKSQEINNLAVNTTYFYILKEIEAKDGYSNLLEDCKIIIPTYIDEDLKLKLGHATYNDYDGKFIIVKNNEKVNENDPLYDNVKVEIDETNRTLKIFVKNKKLNGSYKFYVKKIDQAGENIDGIEEGISFNCDIQQSPVDSVGNLNNKAIQVMENGFGVFTREIQSEGTETITLTELVTKENNKHIELQDPITITLTKGTITENDVSRYGITDISLGQNEQEDPPSQSQIDQGVIKQIKTNAKLANDKGTVEVRARMYGTGNKVTIVFRNPKITGSYGLQIEKTGKEETTKLKNVTFNVKSNNNNASEESYITDTNGIATILSSSNNTITEEGIDIFDITEESVGDDNDYLEYEDTIHVYVKKYIKDNEYKIRYSLDSKTFEIEPENNEVVDLYESSDGNVKLSNNNGLITVSVKNEQITGKYQFKIRKVKNNSAKTPIADIGFSVKKNDKDVETYGSSISDGKTNGVGKVLIQGNDEENYIVKSANKITKGNVNTPDKFEISEINLNGKPYAKLKDPVTVFIKKGIVGEGTEKRYEPIAIAFDSEDNFAEENKTLIYKDNVELENSDVKVKLAAKIWYADQKDKTTVVRITIPNEELTSGYELEIVKTKADGEEQLEGASFTVNKVTEKENSSEETQEELTPVEIEVQSDGATFKTKENIEINQENVGSKDVFEIEEISTDEHYIKLGEAVRIYVAKIFVPGTEETTAHYEIDASFDKDDFSEENKSKELSLEYGTTKVNAKVKVEEGKVVVTIPNKPVTGKYSLELVKEDADDQAKILGAKFTVYKNDDETPIVDKKATSNETGKVGKLEIVTDEPITKDDYSTPDKYTITENTANSSYLKLEDSFDIYVKKERVGNEYKAVGVSFTGNENDFSESAESPELELVNGDKVKVHAVVESSTGKVILTVPNKKLEGSYGIEILKVDDNDKNKTIEGAEFTIIDTEDGEDEEESTATTNENGKAVIAENVPIDGKSVKNKEKDKYTIKEFKAVNYLKLAEPFDIYVSKGANEEKTAFVATGVSFSEDEDTKTKATLNAKLVGGETVEVTAEIVDGNVLITVPNKPVEGKYSLQILKTDENDEPLGNVEFEVKEGTEQVKIKEGSTDNDGVLEIFKDRGITSANLDTPEIFTIKEIATNGNYVAIPEDEDITVYVYRGLNEDETAYEVKAVSFEEIDSSEEDESFDEDDAVTTKNVKLANGKEITLYLNIENGIVTLKIPNHKIEGKFDFELIKIDQKDGESVLPGVTFDIKTMINGEEVTLYDVDGKEIKTTSLTTNKKGKIVLSNVNITEGAKYTFEITETNVPEGYVMLRDPLTLEFTTAVDEDTQTFVIEDADLSGVGNIEVSSNKITVTVQNGEFDLALRKFASSVTVYAGTDQEKTVTVPNREPVFKIDEDGNYTYEHSKDTILVGSESLVEYTLRVYNEGSISGYAKEIKDDIPEGLEFLPENETNQEYGWILVDEEGNEVKEVNKAKYIVTNYLSKEAETVEGENLIEAFDVKAFEAGEIKEPNYMDVKVVFKVTMPNTDDRIVINKAQISDDSDKDGEDVTDKDSTPDEWIEGEDDQDTEELKVQYFDLSLRKWITNVITIEDGKENSVATGHKAEDDPEEIVKVDLKDSKINDVVVKFVYKIRVKNEGEISGYAKEISDYIPQGLKFDAAENPNWKEVEGKIVTEELKDTLLKPGDTAEVEVILTWINRKDNLGLKENVAEISKDYNVFGTPDIDSTPNNQVPGEDDIDDAKVLLTVKTGEAVTYVGLAIAVLAILGSGIVLIKKYVIK